MIITRFIRVTLLTQGSILSVVEYNNQQYEVYTNTLHNCRRVVQDNKYVTQCHIKEEFLTQRNN